MTRARKRRRALAWKRYVRATGGRHTKLPPGWLKAVLVGHGWSAAKFERTMLAAKRLARKPEPLPMPRFELPPHAFSSDTLAFKMRTIYGHPVVRPITRIPLTGV